MDRGHEAAQRLAESAPGAPALFCEPLGLAPWRSEIPRRRRAVQRRVRRRRRAAEPPAPRDGGPCAADFYFAEVSLLRYYATDCRDGLPRAADGAPVAPDGLHATSPVQPA